jgi:leucyl/phenylalanyl-tRNA--protein transferase
VPVYVLGEDIAFPPVDGAEDGLVAVGGDLSIERLLLAYSTGLFPWYEEGQPILWHSPDPRYVITPDTFHVPRRLDRRLRSSPFRVTLDLAFEAVIEGCARRGREGTWITAAMRDAYIRLHREGLAHSAEAWEDGNLVGGLYGVSLGGAFFGESMFASAPDASKVAFVRLARQMERWAIDLIDCQVHTDHLERFGALAWPRERYLRTLAAAVQQPTRRGTWSFDGEQAEPPEC